MNWRLVIVITTVSLSLQIVKTANILALCSVLSPSHSMWCYSYMKLLADRGHQITVLGIDHPKISIPNMTTFIADEVYIKFSEGDPATDWYIGTDAKLKSMYYAYIPVTKKSSRAMLHSKALQKLLKHYDQKKRPFDLIIHDNCNADALLGLVPLFGSPPLILATAARFPHWMDVNTGNPVHPAHTPTMISGFGPRMTFYERVVNTVHYLFLEWMYYHLINFQDQLMREVFGSTLPHVRDIARRANMVIYNYHPALDGARPMLPGVIGLAGLHITEPQPLPKELDDLMNEAEAGVILVSFGTNVNSKWLPPQFASLILEALRPLKQRVLWKWDQSLPNLPAHIHTSPWLPQGNILAHPKIRLFVSHCGLLGIQEALYHGVPLLSLPVFFDQRENAATLKRLNLTIQHDVTTVTSHQLRQTIQEMLMNPIYKRNMEKTSELIRDMPQTAQEQAVFWTEYVIRHRGALHLRSTATELPTYQLLLLDVLALAVVVTSVLTWLTTAIVVLVIKRTSWLLRVKSD